MSGGVDLSQGERIFGIPPVPVWPELDINTPEEQQHAASTTLAAFHGPACSCGRPFGICYDLDAILRKGRDPNETLLHELVHAWQYHEDPEHCQASHNWELEQYGYWDAPHEVEARLLSRALSEAGVQVFFPG